ncbi:hypothetical protein A2U01_0029463, partial [Trifolium medium]|nr:hypothetical protein [Trifolium medium]
VRRRFAIKKGGGGLRRNVSTSSSESIKDPDVSSPLQCTDRAVLGGIELEVVLPTIDRIVQAANCEGSGLGTLLLQEDVAYGSAHRFPMIVGSFNIRGLGSRVNMRKVLCVIAFRETLTATGSSYRLLDIVETSLGNKFGVLWLMCMLNVILRTKEDFGM